jgi:branched-chain amino acid transport system ATP-binding protein
VRYRGEELIARPSNHIARRGLALCPEERGIFASLSVQENLLLPPVVQAGGLGLEAIYALFPNLRERGRSQGTKLSGGEQQMLAIGRILRTGARLLLLDEPTAGMSPEETQRMTRMLEALPREVTLLIIEHDMDVVGSLADRVTVLHYGEVLTEGSFAEVKADPRVYEVYLGHA